MKSYRDTLAFRYLEGTKYGRHTIYKKDDRIAVGRPSTYKTYPDAPKMDLPEPRLEGETSFWRVLQQRRSRRQYSSEPISQENLSHLLWATQGITALRRGFAFRTAPSAGALYPVETYLCVQRISGISPGIYHYNVLDFSLEQIRPGSFGKEFAAAALGQQMVARGAVMFIWTAVVFRAMWKYRNRCLRYIFMDSGHIAQNLQLAATALDLGCCPIGAFFDDHVNELIGVDGDKERAIYLASVGRVKGNEID